MRSCLNGRLPANVREADIGCMVANLLSHRCRVKAATEAIPLYLTHSSQNRAAESAFSLLYREGHEHARDVRHTGPVKGANRNRLLDHGKGTRDLRNDVQVPFGRTIIDGPQGIDGTSAAVPKREATTVYQSIVRSRDLMHSIDLLSRQAEGLTRIKLTGELTKDQGRCGMTAHREEDQDKQQRDDKELGESPRETSHRCTLLCMVIVMTGKRTKGTQSADGKRPTRNKLHQERKCPHPFIREQVTPLPHLR